MSGAIAAASAAAAGTVRIGGRDVRRMGFGAMRITGEGIWGAPPDRDAALRVLRRVVELGVDFIDTADSYGPGVSEELIAEALHPYPAGLMIATKGGFAREGPGKWERDCRPGRLRRACEGSLRRLRLERIEVYQLHAVDEDVPIEESIGALVELQDEGKIGHIGVSNVDEDELRRAQAMTAVVSVQNRYNVFDRRFEALVDLSGREGLAFLPWAPLDANKRDDPVLREIARSHGAPPHQVMLAWLLSRSPTILAIPGTGSVVHAEENVAAAALELTTRELERIEALGRDHRD
jgi:aryl-alcohol dehydrogenase-like predicted oxidoreductase